METTWAHACIFKLNFIQSKYRFSISDEIQCSNWDISVKYALDFKDLVQKWTISWIIFILIMCSNDHILDILNMLNMLKLILTVYFLKYGY